MRRYKYFLKLHFFYISLPRLIAIGFVNVKCRIFLLFSHIKWNNGPLRRRNKKSEYTIQKLN